MLQLKYNKSINKQNKGGFEMTKKVIFDTNVFLEMGGKYSFENLKAAGELILGQKIEKIVIPDAVYSELEHIKKGTPKNEDAICIYSRIGKEIDKGILEYEDFDFDKKDVDSSLIDYAIEKGIPLITLDNRAKIRYSAKSGEARNCCDINNFKKIINLSKELDDVSQKNLANYIEKMLDEKFLDLVTFIELSESERAKKVFEYIIVKALKDEEAEVIETIKNNYFTFKEGKINAILLRKTLNQLKKYSFGKIEVNENPKEKYADLIKRFLEEKNFSSFEELIKAQPFLREEELIESILRYYSEEENGDEKI